jgi:nicotinamide mononucleotide transporter
MDQYIELIGTIVGLIYLLLEYRASIYMWLVGIIMPAIYIYIYYSAGLYANFGINIYYLLAAIYGYLSWRGLLGKTGQDKSFSITRTPKRGWCIAGVMYVVAQAFITWLLINYTDSTTPIMDAFTTALSIVGMWMLARGYIEQWWTWCVVDLACSALYWHTGLHFTAGLYLVYAIVAVFGYMKWKSMINNEHVEG